MPHLVDATMFWSARGGGVRRYLLAKRARLCASGGWRQTIVAPHVCGDGMVDCGGVPLPGSGGYRIPLNRRAAARLIAARRPDIIEAGDPYRIAWAALDAARERGVPAILFCHSDIATLAARTVLRWFASEGSTATRIADATGAQVARYLARACAAFDLVLAPSRALQQRLREFGIGNVEYQPLGVDTAVFAPAARDERWRRALGLPRDARLLIYVGRFAPEKNLPVLVAAVARLGAPYHLLALGSGPCVPHGERVRVLDFEADPVRVARALASADAFVHAGDQETFGLSVLEAMACGTPVIVRGAAGLAEIADGCGITVDSARPDEWAGAIDAAFGATRPSASAALARARAHDWSLVFARLRGHYEHALAGARRGAVQ